MLKYIYLILMIACSIFITSCKKEQTYIEVKKVDISNNLIYEKCYLELDIITTTNIVDLNIYFDDSRYTYIKNKDLKKEDNNYLYLHRFYVNFKNEEVSLDKVIVEHNDNKETYDLGKYDCSIYENSTNDVKTSTNISNNKLDLYISNETYSNIQITSIIPLSTNLSHTLNISKIPSHKQKIPSKEVEKYSIITIDFDNQYLQVMKKIKIEIIINNKKEYIYASYCYDKRKM